MFSILVFDKTGAAWSFESLHDAEAFIRKTVSGNGYLKPVEIFRAKGSDNRAPKGFPAGLYTLKSVAVWMYANMSIDVYVVLESCVA